MRQILTKIKQQQIIMFEWVLIDIIWALLQRKSQNSKIEPPNNKTNINVITMIENPIEISSKNLKKVTNKIIKTELNIPVLKVLTTINPKISYNDFNYQIFKNKNCAILKVCDLSSNQITIFLKIFSKKSSKYIYGTTNYIPITLIKNKLAFNK